MEKDTELIFEKLRCLIDSSKEEDKTIVTRYLSLANRRLNNIVDQKGCKDTWAIIGDSYGIKDRYEDKFGTFFPKYQPILER